jgi:hypothetical protein
MTKLETIEQGFPLAVPPLNPDRSLRTSIAEVDHLLGAAVE